MKRIGFGWSQMALAAVVIACGVSVASAGVLTWTGTTGKWSNQDDSYYNHWSDGTSTTLPWTAGSDAVIGTYVPNTDGSTAIVIGDITYTGGSKQQGSQSFMLAGDESSTSTIVANTVDFDVQVSIAGTAGLTKAGVKKLTLSGVNTYSGDTTVAAGYLKAGNTLALQNSTLVYTTGTFGFTGITSAVLGGLTTSKTFYLTQNASPTGAAVAVSVGNNGQDTTVTGVLAGSGSLEKIGAGTLTLTKLNTYTGVTTVTAGTLQLSGNVSIASSPTITVASGATFDVDAVNNSYSVASGQTLQGTGGSVKGETTIASGATLAGSLNFDYKLTLADGSSTSLEIGASSNDLIAVVGALALGGDLTVTDDGSITYAAGQSWTLFSSSEFSGSFNSVALPTLSGGLSWDTSALETTGVISVAAVPEPATAVMLLGGLLGLIAYAWRKRK